MAFNFPNSPATGDVFAPSGGPSYRYSGSVWTVLAQPFQGAFPSDTPPPNPVNGQLWWETDTGLLYVYYTDANSSQWVEVVSSSMPDPPADGNEYVRVNGAWRLKSQTYDLSGKTTQDINVPAWGPSMVRLTWNGLMTNGGITYIHLQLSTDGTTFPAGASDYTTAGFQHHSGSAGFATAAAFAGGSWELDGAHDHTQIPRHGAAEVNLTRASNDHLFSFRSRGATFYNNAVGMFMQMNFGGWAGFGTWPGAGPVKVLRFIITTSPVVRGQLNAEWL